MDITKFTIDVYDLIQEMGTVEVVLSTLDTLPDIIIPQNLIPLLFVLPDPYTYEQLTDVIQKLQIHKFQEFRINNNCGTDPVLWGKGRFKSFKNRLMWSISMILQITKKVDPKTKDMNDHELLRYAFIVHNGLTKNA